MFYWDDECFDMRTRCHMTQAEAARTCFVNPKTWRRWEHGYTRPPEYIKESVREAMHQEYIAYLGAALAMKRRLSEVTGRA